MIRFRFPLFFLLLLPNLIGAQNNIIFKTEGSSFTPLISLNQHATVLWTFSDGTTSNFLNPEKDFGSADSRFQSLQVTPWNAVEMINIGYDASDEGWYLPLVPDQKVSEIQNLQLVKDSLKYWCSSYNLLDSLNFDNFTNLQDIECYQSDSLKYVSLKNTPALKRLCLEQSNLQALDISESPTLQDLRCAINHYTDVKFSQSTEDFFHVCVRDNPQMTNDNLFTHMEMFPNIAQLFIWNTNQTGAFKLINNSKTRDVSIMASTNRFTSIDFSGTLQNENGYAELYFDQNPIREINIRGCKQIKVLSLGWNEMPADVVSSVLEQLDSLGTSNGRVFLAGNEPPTAQGLLHKENLEKKAWQVYITGAWISIMGANIEIQNNDSTPELNDLTAFGNISISDSVLHQYKIQNQGSMVLNLTGWPLIKLSGPNASEFKVVHFPVSNVPAWYGSSEFSIQFKPESSGEKMAFVSIENDGADNKHPYKFAISGSSGYVNVGTKTDFKQMSVYPNPCSTYISINNIPVSTSSNVELISLEGKKYHLGIISKKVTKLNLPKLTPGFYFVHLFNKDGTSFQKILVK